MSPGIYLFRDSAGEVIYVGKAKNLRARVRQYARGGDGRVQITFLLSQLADVEVLITRSEKEALLLSDPKKFFTTPHYDGHPTVLVILWWKKPW
jgi:excinuclease ABC subunit C